MKRWLSVALMTGLLVGTVGGSTPVGQDMTTLLSKFLQDLWAGTFEINTATDNYNLGESSLSQVAYSAHTGENGGAGWGNVAIGTYAQRYLTTGYQNSCVGYRCMESDDTNKLTGLWNTSNGDYSLNDLTSGSLNSCFGEAACQKITTGSGNSVLGYDALYVATTLSQLTAIGGASLNGFSAGTAMVAVGFNTGRYVPDSTRSIYLGYQAGMHDRVPYSISTSPEDDMLHIEGGASPEQPFIFGEMAKDRLTLRGNTIIVNATNAAGTKHNLLGSETLPTIVGGTWTRTGDFAISGAYATYTHSAGSGNIIAAFSLAPTPNTWYELTFTIDQATTYSAGAMPACAFTLSAADSFISPAQYLPVVDGTYYIRLLASGAPENFVMRGGSTGTCTFRVSGISMKQMQGGTLAAYASVDTQIFKGWDRTGTDLTGFDTYLKAGNGTGTGGSGSLIFQTAPAAGSSATANTLATRLIVDASGYVTVGTAAGTGANRLYAGSYYVGTTAGADCTSAAAVTTVKGIVTVCSEPIPDPLTQAEINALRGLLAQMRGGQ